eukprot:gene19218-25837_t
MAVPRIRHEWLSAYSRQTGALLKKNCLIRLRSWKSNVLQILSTFLLIFIIWAVDQAVTYSSSQFMGKGAVREPKPTPIDPIPDCRDNLYLKRGQSCYTIIYSPLGDPLVESIMEAVIRNNEPPLDRDSVIGMESQDQTHSDKPEAS